MGKDKVLDMEHKLPQLQAERKRRTKRRFIIYLAVFTFLIALVLYFQSSFSHVQRVEVQGNDTLSREEVIDMSGLSSEVSIWNLNKEERVEEIENHDVVLSADFSRSFPNTVNISIEEHEIVAYLYQSNGSIPVLSTGALNENADVEAGNAPILRDFNDQTLINQAAEELSKMAPHISARISDIIHTPVENDSSRITLLMNDGHTVSSTLTNFASRMVPYPAVVQQLDEDADGIIHMRINPYFESFDEEDAEEVDNIEEEEEINVENE
ncbi:cell division protein FtsQ/DivIB [Alkalicoccus daliensis]|uniref:Cell division protein DivIB n=1 Tax=Alkalicoccus daliensis TaxID=745820 RepID=A0A1G9ZVI7_9BACI|nr:FtsQ-type POTRA domain-containing protein [Alkalicoccus daliensis]SDN25114.1 cell division protein FtsQ [Alkalicoccus daliensis]